MPALATELHGPHERAQRPQRGQADDRHRGREPEPPPGARGGPQVQRVLHGQQAHGLRPQRARGVLRPAGVSRPGEGQGLSHLLPRPFPPAGSAQLWLRSSQGWPGFIKDVLTSLRVPCSAGPSVARPQLSSALGSGLSIAASLFRELRVLLKVLTASAPGPLVGCPHRGKQRTSCRFLEDGQIRTESECALLAARKALLPGGGLGGPLGGPGACQNHTGPTCSRENAGLLCHKNC